MKSWYKNGINWLPINADNVKDRLPVGVYTLIETMNGMAAEFKCDKFTFDYKVYGLESDLIQRVPKTYQGLNGNVGILLNGLKGTGKSVTAQQIANEVLALGIPVIIVPYDYKGLADFISDAPQELCFFFDEYEKIFPMGKNKDGESLSGEQALLSVMDGAQKSEFRRMWLLTTNNAHINENMLQRPGRIRYRKDFGNLNVKAVQEILDDRLENKAYETDLLSYVSRLECVTVDIVLAIIDEVNIHNENTEGFSSIFNVKERTEVFDLYIVQEDADSPTGVKETMRGKNVRVVTIGRVGDAVYFSHDLAGYIHEIIKPGTEWILRKHYGPFPKTDKLAAEEEIVQEILGEGFGGGDFGDQGTDPRPFVLVHYKVVEPMPSYSRMNELVY